MEKRYGLCLKVLRCLQATGVLEDLILVGSWCLYFYKDYFSGTTYTPSIRTRDIDFLVPIPVRFSHKVDIAALLKNEGFITTFSRDGGYIRLEHPELIIEFLVPEKGRGAKGPYPLPHIGVNAQPLRFLDFLADNVTSVDLQGLRIKVPHPAAFALHKLLIFKRRRTIEKQLKERREALYVLKVLISMGNSEIIVSKFNSMHTSWQKKIQSVLRELEETEILKILQ